MGNIYVIINGEMVTKELVLIQSQRKITNEQIADALGLHKHSWLRIKRTKKMSIGTALRVGIVFPQLLPLVQKLVAEKVTGGKIYASHKKHYNPKLSRLERLKDSLYKLGIKIRQLSFHGSPLG